MYGMLRSPFGRSRAKPRAMIHAATKRNLTGQGTTDRRRILALAWVVGSLLSSCVSPLPTSTPRSSGTAQSVDGTPSHTVSASPEESLPPFGEASPDEGWVVLLSRDASTATERRFALPNPVRAGAPLRVVYACAGGGIISLRIYEAAPPATGGPDVANRSDDCGLQIQRFATAGPSAQRWIGLDVTVSDPVARYWAVLTVPAEDIVPVD